MLEASTIQLSINIAAGAGILAETLYVVVLRRRLHDMEHDLADRDEEIARFEQYVDTIEG